MNIIPFFNNQHEVRTIEEDGTLWFVAQDISSALGYRSAEQVVRGLDDDEADTRIVCIRSQNGITQNREVIVISESGLYHALFLSRRPEAKAFRRWVTDEVLPSIRKIGEYRCNPKAVGREWDRITYTMDRSYSRALTRFDQHSTEENRKNLEFWAAEMKKLVSIQNAAYASLCNSNPLH